MAYERVVGECLHLASGFLCTEGKHQNYPCPYANIAKCSCSIPITEEMAESWKTKGYNIVKLNF